MNNIAKEHFGWAGLGFGMQMSESYEFAIQLMGSRVADGYHVAKRGWHLYAQPASGGRASHAWR